MPRVTAQPTKSPRSWAAAKPRARRAAHRRQWPALALFLLLAALYVLTSGGHTYSYDEETIFGLTESLVERGSIVVPTCAGCTIIHSEPAPGGRNYSRYGPLQSFVAVPFYVAGRAVAGENDAARWFLTRFAVDMMTPLVTAVTAALLYLLARWLGYRHGAALAAARAYGLGTQAGPPRNTVFSEPLTPSRLLGAVCCGWRLA
ncbi:MAG: hypothetical protein ACTHMR_04055, partial [Thermomicrobiales bacterium]